MSTFFGLPEQGAFPPRPPALAFFTISLRPSFQTLPKHFKLFNRGSRCLGYFPASFRFDLRRWVATTIIACFLQGGSLRVGMFDGYHTRC